MGRWGLVGDAGTSTDVPTKQMYLTAANAILRASHVLIAAGAGMSADSGLPVYDAIAQIAAYETAGVSYSDLCRPALLETNPSLALGFWGSCFNKYRETPPHEGYSILRKWCDHKRGWYVYTSNVDGHFVGSNFEADHVQEIHGRLDRWISCNEQEAASMVLPPGHTIKVDSETMHLAGDPGDCGVPLDAAGRAMRPGVLMFEDEHPLLMRALKEGQDRYQAWEAQMEEEMAGDGTARLVVVELGCGTRVPAVRLESEEVLRDTLSKLGAAQGGETEGEGWWEKDGAQLPRAMIIRINPDYPNNPRDPAHTLPLRAGALEALKAIDKCMLADVGTRTA